MLRHNSRIFLIQIFEFANIFENFDQKSQRTWFFAPQFFFFFKSLFWQKFSKICPKIKIWKKKKKFLEKCLNMIFKQF